MYELIPCLGCGKDEYLEIERSPINEKTLLIRLLEFHVGNATYTLNIINPKIML